MKLTDLQPAFVTYEKDGTHEKMTAVASIEAAQGIRFMCPKCYDGLGSHYIVCWSRSRGVQDWVRPGPGRWKLDGNDFSDLTLNAEVTGGARSVHLQGYCGWHGHVTNGEVTDA